MGEGLIKALSGTSRGEDAGQREREKPYRWFRSVRLKG